MELFNRRRIDIKEKKDYVTEPVRGSISVLIIKMLVILALFDGAYSIIYYVLNLGISLPFDLHHHAAILLLITQFVKTILQMTLLLRIVLQWANNVYFLTDEHIIKRSGLLKIQEETFHYENIRSITIHQSWIGKLFNYGDILLKISASGGFQDDIELSGIENPQKHKKRLQDLF